MINTIIAYGGFHGYEEDLILTYKLFFKNIWIVWLMAIVISEQMKKSTISKLVSLALFLVIVAMILPAMGVMGEYGPAHIAHEYAGYSSMIACWYLIIKSVIYSFIYRTKNKKNET